MVELVPSLLRQELARLAEEDNRIDGRGRWDARDVSLETDCLYNAEGSAKVVIGGTVVYAGVKFELRTPWPDRPTQGSLMCGAELRPVAGRKYEPGPPPLSPLSWAVWLTEASVSPVASIWRASALFPARRSGAS